MRLINRTDFQRYISLFFIFSISFVYSQNEVSLEKKYISDEYYLYQIESSINGIKTKMLIDTGASYSLLQDSFVEELLDSGHISLDDISPTLQRVLGFLGDEEGLMVVNIKEVSVQNIKYNNIKFLIGKDQRVPNIIGLNLLERFDKLNFNLKDLKLQIQ